MKDRIRPWALPLLFALIGAVCGWLYYRFVGCATGTCPITSSPILMPLYSGGIGLFLGVGFQPRKK